MWPAVRAFLDEFVPDWQAWLTLAIVAAIAIGALRLLIGVPAGSDEH